MALQRKSHPLFKHRFSLFFFLYLVFYNVVITNRLRLWEVDDYAIYSFYAVDFSYGFATKLLPGAIFRALFRSHASRSTATIFLTVLMLLFFAGVALLLERFLLHVPKEQRNAAFFLLLFFVSGAYTFSIFTKTLGLLDTFWLFGALLFFFLIEHQLLRYLIPLIFALSILVHNASLISYIVLMSVVLLYRASIAKEKKERRSFLTVFVLSVSVAAALFVFFSLFETKLICSLETFHEKLRSHGSDVFYYYDYAFFDIYNGEQYIPDEVYSVESAFLRFLYIIYYRIKLNVRVVLMNSSIHLTSICCGFVVLLPILCFFIQSHRKQLIKKGNGLRRFCAFLMMVQFPFTLLVALPFSEDFTRWLTHAFLIAFTLLLTVLYYEPEQRTLFFEKLKPIAETTWAKLFFVAYASINVFTIY